jgi:predicted enzyme related to lactoylglutathione lyase
VKSARAIARADLVRCGMAKVLGLGGLFFKANDPTGLLGWYRDVLGVELTDWGGVMFSPELMATQPGAATIFAGFARDSDYFEPSNKPFMVNFVVDDLDGILARCKEHGVAVIKHSEEAHGRFAHILDPEGMKLELWQPFVPPAET